MLDTDTNRLNPGQVVALFIVGFGEYAVVWLGTDWNKEVQKGVDRNIQQAKIQTMNAERDEEHAEEA